MKIALSLQTTLGETQTAFAEAFPGLKLVFFSKPHQAYKGSAAKFMLMEKEMLLSEASPALTACELNLVSEMSVSSVEQLFESECGLHVQVFRRSGRTWLETSVSDDLTLAQQMEKAAASDNIHPEFVDPLDYRDMD